MAILPANMNDCAEKKRCLSGPNEGLAYDPNNTCDPNYSVEFNPLTCDCEDYLLPCYQCLRVVSATSNLYWTVGFTVACFPAPYYDGNGNLIEYKFSFGSPGSAQWSDVICRKSSVFDCMSALSASTVITGYYNPPTDYYCSGGTNYAFSVNKIKYVNGAYNSFDTFFARINGSNTASGESGLCYQNQGESFAATLELYCN